MLKWLRNYAFYRMNGIVTRIFDERKSQRQKEEEDEETTAGWCAAVILQLWHTLWDKRKIKS